MNKSIATEKEKIFDRYKKEYSYDYDLYGEEILPFLSHSLDHIAAVARQEGREEAIELYKPILKVCERYNNNELPSSEEMALVNIAIEKIKQNEK